MSEQMQTAIQWLASVPHGSRPRPLIPFLKQQFELSALQAIEVINTARSQSYNKDSQHVR